MAGDHEGVCIAVNVMRARLTVLGFNIAIISFQLNELRSLGGGVTLPGLDGQVHVPASTALLLGLALSITAMVVFIGSSAFDREGCCTPWLVLPGDLLMYLALAQTVAGFFGPFAQVIGQAVLPDGQQMLAFSTLSTAIAAAGGIAWAMAMYAGPVVSLLRSPLRPRATVAFGLGYAVLVLLVARVGARAAFVQSQRLGLDPQGSGLLDALVAPLRW